MGYIRAPVVVEGEIVHEKAAASIPIAAAAAASSAASSLNHQDNKTSAVGAAQPSQRTLPAAVCRPQGAMILRQPQPLLAAAVERLQQQQQPTVAQILDARHFRSIVLKCFFAAVLVLVLALCFRGGDKTTSTGSGGGVGAGEVKALTGRVFSLEQSRNQLAARVQELSRLRDKDRELFEHLQVRFNAAAEKGLRERSKLSEQVVALEKKVAELSAAAKDCKSNSGSSSGKNNGPTPPAPPAQKSSDAFPFQLFAGDEGLPRRARRVFNYLRDNL